MSGLEIFGWLLLAIIIGPAAALGLKAYFCAFLDIWRSIE